MDWLNRMNSVLDYIENNLDGDINYNEVATLSACSKGMFQRIFANITDMTLAEYIRKRRLTQAAIDIKNTNMKIIDIAVKYGYNSADAFSSAFKLFHKIRPAKLRMTNARHKSFQRKTFTIIFSDKEREDFSMDYRIVEREAFQIVGVKDPKGGDNFYESEEMAKLYRLIEANYWMSLYKEAGNDEVIANAISQVEETRGLLYFCAYDYDENGNHSFITGIEKGIAGTAGFDVIDVPAATYAVFSYNRDITPRGWEVAEDIINKSGLKRAYTPNFGIHYDNAEDGEDGDESWFPIIK